jgi:hypothetical protein
MSLWIRLVLVFGVFACSGGFTTSHPGGSQKADDKKSPKRSLAEEAQLLGPKAGKTRWFSDDLATGQASKKEKIYAFMQFEPTAGKPSGKVALGTESRSDRAVSGAGCRYTFELVENGGQRLLKLSEGNANFDGAGKPYVPVLYYSIDGDTLTISYPPLVGWPGNVGKIQFRRSK